ncbi:uncharacterized protein At1g76660-like isoform X2 [Impatiens glandulifera]|uniref:uncharacterized protein At1g76660-like isoform X2 n=1 Tax=Impatiens glandulifera TaxID=253017 RepID=UPI001FB05F39|nr:uncharacterized protein At1g76660-like isoform X2 [Impatiens glandulifera]
MEFLSTLFFIRQISLLSLSLSLYCKIYQLSPSARATAFSLSDAFIHTTITPQCEDDTLKSSLAMALEENRIPQQQQHLLQQAQAPSRRNKRWRGCLGGLSCFGSQKGNKRIVPSSRVPETNTLSNVQNAPQNQALANPATALVPSLLAPPSSPASFSNSALPSTAQSPSSFLSLSANSPGGPSSSMFATGPYAHETQLVSPPIFSTFTTEPSTAPLTPPPELAHLTTPSSPDVPFAQFLRSSMDLKRTDNTNYAPPNDLHSAYALYPGSPASSLISPVSGTSVALGTTNDSKVSHDSNFFCPATFAQFYLDNSSLHSGGRLSVSKESDVVCGNNNNNSHQNKQSRSSKQDMEEIEAYRASFGFSADEIITTAHYVEISDIQDPNMQSISRSQSKRNEVEDIFARMETSKISRRYGHGQSISDAEVDYRKGRGLRQGSGEFWLG